jgi:hypothetical protein
MQNRQPEPEPLDLTKEPPEGPVPQPTIAPYDPTRLREHTRTWVVAGIGIILAVTIIGLFVLVWRGKIEGPDFMKAVYSPLVTLAGTALGFYFGGGRDRTG